MPCHPNPILVFVLAPQLLQQVVVFASRGCLKPIKTSSLSRRKSHKDSRAAGLLDDDVGGHYVALSVVSRQGQPGTMDLSEQEMLTFRSDSRKTLKSFGSRSEYRYRIVENATKWSYVADWFFVIFLIFVSVYFDPAPVFEKYITQGELDSGTYSYPLRPNSFPSWALLPACILFPCLVITCCLKIVKRSPPGQLHHALLGLFMSLGFTNALTCVLKLMIGRPRPDFMARCFDGNVPDPVPWIRPGYPDCTGDPGGAPIRRALPLACQP